MAEKMLDSTGEGMTRSSSHLASINSNDSLELVRENGQVRVHGGSSSATRKTPSSIRYLANPSHGKEANQEDACNAKRARLSSLYPLSDLPRWDSDLDSSHQNPRQLDLQSYKSKSSSTFKDAYANLRPAKESKLDGGAHQPVTTGNVYLCTPFTKQCLPSTQLKKMDSCQTQATNSQKKDLVKVNFFKPVRPSVFVKSTYQGSRATLPTKSAVLARVDEIKASKAPKADAAATTNKAPDHSVVIHSSRGSHGLTELQGQTPLISEASNQVSFVAKIGEPLPDEKSEAVGGNSALSNHGSRGQNYNQTSSSARFRPKGKADTNFCNEPLLESSSICSLEASENTNVCSRKQEDTVDSTYSSDNDEEPEDVGKEKPAREGSRDKRRRNAENHNFCERNRRAKINKKLRVLKEVIPNCNKMDKASVLDDAIKYLKTLKLQLQIMSMGTPLCKPLMMLPTAAHPMINTPNIPQLMGAGMGFWPGTGIPCSLPQFPIPPLPGMVDNRFGMFGFPNQMPSMPISHEPFIPMVGNPSTQPPQATCTTHPPGGKSSFCAANNSKGVSPQELIS